MYSTITNHLLRQMQYDADFLQRWTTLDFSDRRLYLAHLTAIEKRRREIVACGVDCETWQAETLKPLAEALRTAREMDFAFDLTPEQWVAAGRNKSQQRHLYRQGNRLLLSFLARQGIAPVRFYGGIKRGAAVEAKIARNRIVGSPLELWDLVRYRIVVSGIDELLMVAKSMQDAFAGNVIRCRNYYVRPREGSGNPYRGIHLEITAPERGFFEVQLLTALRDTVGLLDHSFLLKRVVPFAGSRHEYWVRSFSMAANVLDAERAVSTRQLPDSKITPRTVTPCIQ